MSKSRLFVVLAMAAAFAFVACSDDGETPKLDNGQKLDGGTVDDMTEDAPVLVDLPLPADQGSGKCDPTCTSAKKWECVKSGTSCVECTTDAHCKSNPWALGNKCDVANNFCVCSGDSDCASSNWGHKCDTSNQLCGCSTTAECNSGMQCGGDLPFTSSLSACADPCKTDADCTGSAGFCDTATGACIECKTDTDCATASGGKFCSSKKTCIDCKVSTDCASNTFEKTCDPTAGCVECLKDGDCTVESLGNKCDTSSNFCVCAADTDCSANNNGHKCDSSNKLCNCKADADCNSTTKCIFPFSSSINLCKKPCTADTECTQDPTKPACATTGTSAGLCVECSKDTHCGGAVKFCGTGNTCIDCKTNTNCGTSDPFSLTCDTAKGCVECLKDADCGAASLGNKCTTGRCQCAADADCASNNNGKKCDTKYKICDCTADSDCASTKKCIFELSAQTPPNPKVCATPCKTNADCKLTALPVCDATSGLCVQCKTAADCAAHQNGKACVSDACTCAADADCKGTYPWGAKCDTTTYKRCSCGSDADCTSNPNGPTCYSTFKKCSCTKDADCKTAPYTKCALPYAGAAYKNCQKP